MSIFGKDKKNENAKPADFSNVTGGHSSTARTIEPTVPAGPPAHAPEIPVGSGPSARTYTVVSGDSLSKIAKRIYGDMKRWTEIYAANKSVIGDDPDRIEPGQVLTLPA